ncbi:hypothetical protein Tco_0889394 [Tanacetum coccineum]
MSTSKTYQQSLADAGSETRPPMLERGSYIPWASRFKRFLNRKRENRKWLLKALEDGPYVFRNITPTGSTIPRLQEVEDLQGDDLLYYDAEMELMNMILLSIPNEIYNSVDSCKTAKEMWARVERLMRGTIQNQVDRETRFTNEFDQFVAEPGESLVSIYNRFAQLMNDLERNYKVSNCFIDSFDDLFDYLSQFEKLVNNLRVKKLEKSHDPLALVAHTGSSSRNTSSYYVTHPSSVVDYDKEYEHDDVHNHSEDPLASAMLLLAKNLLVTISELKSRMKNAKNGMNATSSVTRPKSRDSHVKTSVLDVSKNEANKEAVYVRKNKQTDNTFAKVVSNKENVIDVAVANASKAKTLLCVSCMQSVLIPCHDKCVAKHKLNVRSNARRTFSVNSRIPKSSETTFVAPKTRFSKKVTQSKTLDTTSVASKSKIDEASASKARDKVFLFGNWKRISNKRTKNQAKTDKTKHGVGKRGKAKVKSKPKSTQVKVNPEKSTVNTEADIEEY